MSTRVPKKGDFISYYFHDQTGHEQRGRRPALVVSNNAFNELTGVAFVCPITNTNRAYPFHLPIPLGCNVSGVVMVDQLKAIDYKQRKLSFLSNAPLSLVDEVLSIVGRIVN